MCTYKIQKIALNGWDTRILVTSTFKEQVSNYYSYQY